jgi:hypothetical protein
MLPVRVDWTSDLREGGLDFQSRTVGLGLTREGGLGLTREGGLGLTREGGLGLKD